jgi:hypothetical protein
MQMLDLGWLCCSKTYSMAWHAPFQGLGEIGHRLAALSNLSAAGRVRRRTMTECRMMNPNRRKEIMARHPKAKRARQTGIKNGVKRHGRQFYGLFYKGKPIAGMFRILPIPDICA